VVRKERLCTGGIPEEGSQRVARIREKLVLWRGVVENKRTATCSQLSLGWGYGGADDGRARACAVG